MSISIEFVSVSKNFSGHAALKKVSCSLAGYGIWGLLGPNGAGKSTFMNILCGILPPSSGIVKRVGFVQEVGFAPEKAPLYNSMTVEQYLTFCAKVKGGGESWGEKVIAQFELQSVRKRYIEVLSRGFRQRVNLAQALLGDPKVIILDEPFVGLDPLSVKEMREQIFNLSSHHLILLSSHQLREIEDICEQLIFLHHGKLLDVGTKQEMLNKIFSKQVVQLEVTNISASILSSFCSTFSCKLIEEVRHNEFVSLTLEYSALNDLRSKMVRFLVEHKIDLLAISLQELHLDEIFQRLVQ